MWVLPEGWRRERPKLGIPEGLFPVLPGGWEEKVLWLSSEEIRDDWKPFREKKDLAFMPSWMRIGVMVHFAAYPRSTWPPADARPSYPDKPQGEIVQVRPKIGWVVVNAVLPLKDFYPDEYTKSAGRSLAHSFFWTEQRYMCFFLPASVALYELHPLVKPTMWDRIMLDPV